MVIFRRIRRQQILFLTIYFQHHNKSRIDDDLTNAVGYGVEQNSIDSSHKRSSQFSINSLCTAQQTQPFLSIPTVMELLPNSRRSFHSHTAEALQCFALAKRLWQPPPKRTCASDLLHSHRTDRTRTRHGMSSDDFCDFLRTHSDAKTPLGVAITDSIITEVHSTRPDPPSIALLIITCRS